MPKLFAFAAAVATIKFLILLKFLTLLLGVVVVAKGKRLDQGLI